MKEIVQKLYDKVKSLENSADKAERKLPSYQTWITFKDFTLS